MATTNNPNTQALVIIIKTNIIHRQVIEIFVPELKQPPPTQKSYNSKSFYPSTRKKTRPASPIPTKTDAYETSGERLSTLPPQPCSTRRILPQGFLDLGNLGSSLQSSFTIYPLQPTITSRNSITLAKMSHLQSQAPAIFRVPRLPSPKTVRELGGSS